MNKNKIIYSLTSRGLFSEIFNLVLAVVYAELHNERIIVNTYNWNAKIDKGWEDYFLPTIKCVNNYFSSQLKIYSKEKIWIGNIYYKPHVFFRFYSNYIANNLYKIIHPKAELSDAVFERMRAKEFLDAYDFKSLLSVTIKNVFKYNEQTNQFLKNQKKRMNLPNDYIGVHIRRGDKIATHEMNEININTYIKEILRCKDISSNVYIATDDCSVVPSIKRYLLNSGFNVYYNSNNIHSGFNEDTFNSKSSEERYADMMNTLLDIDILINSEFFIGTYSSNMSKIIPLYLGFSKCTSLDDDWRII